jgi:hypothetical protein
VAQIPHSTALRWWSLLLLPRSPLRLPVRAQAKGPVAIAELKPSHLPPLGGWLLRDQYANWAV